MATERQIAANQQNAKRSTGPRTLAGKKSSSRNSYKHGLSLALQPDGATRAQMELLVRQAAGPEASDECLEAATDYATAYYDIGRVRKVRAEIFSDLSLAKATPEELDVLIAIDRYDSRAQTRQRRAATRLRRSIRI
jgi:hypothetical protein